MSGRIRKEYSTFEKEDFFHLNVSVRFLENRGKCSHKCEGKDFLHFFRERQECESGEYVETNIVRLCEENCVKTEEIEKMSKTRDRECKKGTAWACVTENVSRLCQCEREKRVRVKREGCASECAWERMHHIHYCRTLPTHPLCIPCLHFFSLSFSLPLRFSLPLSTEVPTYPPT